MKYHPWKNLQQRSREVETYQYLIEDYLDISLSLTDAEKLKIIKQISVNDNLRKTVAHIPNIVFQGKLYLIPKADFNTILCFDKATSCFQPYELFKTVPA